MTSLQTSPVATHVCTCASAYADNYTPGTWSTEVESEAALDKALEATGMFSIYKQVRGHYLSPRPDTEDKSPRIDRVLLPTSRLTALGWEHGIIGIECKRSGEKIGRPISQMLDYSRAMWSIGDGAYVVCKWVLLWPLNPLGGPIASIMAQNRLGGALVDGYHGLCFHSANTQLARFKNGTAEIQAVKHGGKVGSR